MTRDYKPTRKKTRSKKKSATPGWVWMLAGLLAGAAASSVFWFQQQPSENNTAETKQTSTAKAPAKKTEKQLPPEEKSRFDFYTILPEMEVAVPDSPEVTERPGNSTTTDKEEAVYYLQAGSFRKHEQADQQKAALSLLGAEVNVQTVTINDGETWHRVTVGPFKTTDEMNRIRKRLHENDVHTMIVRMK